MSRYISRSEDVMGGAPCFSGTRKRLPIAVVVLSARSNNLNALVPLIGKLEHALAALAPCSLVVVHE
jgi:hypothetical protein